MSSGSVKCILCVLLTVLFFPSGLSAQDTARPAAAENIILGAVEKINNYDYDGAQEDLTALLAADDSYDAAWYYLGLVSLMTGERDFALECLTRAAELDPDNYWYRNKLARLYAMTSQQDLAVSEYEKLLDDFPKKSDLYFELVELYVTQQEYDKALSTIDEIERVIGVTESLAVYKYNLLYVLGREGDALESLKSYNSRYSSPYVLALLADHELRMYNDSTALAYYDEALGLDSSFAPALLGKAEALRVRHDYDGYFPVLYRYVETNSAGVEEKTSYLSRLMENSDPRFFSIFQSEMDTVMVKVVEAHPEDSLALSTAGMYHYYMGRNDEAMKCFKKNARLYPESLTQRATYVEFLMYADAWEELAEEGRAAFESFPSETAFLEMASVGDFTLERYDKVIEICNKVIEVAPRDSSKTLRAWATMGDAYHSMGDHKKAYKAYDKALKINPDYIYVLNNYAYYLSEEGKNLKKAYEMSRKTVEAEPDNATYLDTFGWILYLQGKPLEAKPFFKNAMLHGGKESAVILDHYAEVLYALKEYNLAFVYWKMAQQKNNGDVPGLDEKIAARRETTKE